MLAAVPEINSCNSSAATANISLSRIIGNQNKSGMAQVLEVGPLLKNVNC